MLNIELLEHLPLLEGMSAAQLEVLRPYFVIVEYEEETMIFGQGEMAEYLYIVVSGEVVVNFKPDDGPHLTVARVLTGGVVGWSAALGSRTYTSGAMTCANTQMLRVRGADLRWLCETYPDIGAIILDRLAAVIAERLRNTHRQVVSMLQRALFNGAANGLRRPIGG